MIVVYGFNDSVSESGILCASVPTGLRYLDDIDSAEKCYSPTKSRSTSDKSGSCLSAGTSC